MIGFYGMQFGTEYKNDGHWYILHHELARALTKSKTNFTFVIPQGMTNDESYVSKTRIPIAFNQNFSSAFSSRRSIARAFSSLDCDSIFVYEGNIDMVILIMYLNTFLLEDEIRFDINIMGPGLHSYFQQHSIFQFLQRRILRLSKVAGRVRVRSESQMARKTIESTFDIPVTVFDLWPTPTGHEFSTHKFTCEKCTTLIVPAEEIDLEYLNSELDASLSDTGIWVPKSLSRSHLLTKLDRIPFNEIVCGYLDSTQYRELFSRYCRIVLVYTGPRWSCATSARLLELLVTNKPFAVASDTVLSEVAEQWTSSMPQSFNPSRSGDLMKILRLPPTAYTIHHSAPSLDSSIKQITDSLNENISRGDDSIRVRRFMINIRLFTLVNSYVLARRIQKFLKYTKSISRKNHEGEKFHL